MLTAADRNDRTAPIGKQKKGKTHMTTTSGRPTVVTRADWVLGPKQGQWTYQYYAALPNDGQRYEIIDGVLYMPPPSLLDGIRTLQPSFPLILLCMSSLP